MKTKLVLFITLMCFALIKLQGQEILAKYGSGVTEAEYSSSEQLEDRTHIGWELVIKINYASDSTETSRLIREIYYEPMVRKGLVSYLRINWKNIHRQVYSDSGLHEDPSKYDNYYPLLHYDYVEYNKIYYNKKP